MSTRHTRPRADTKGVFLCEQTMDVGSTRADENVNNLSYYRFLKHSDPCSGSSRQPN
jgi:hypothetical protein